MSKVVCKFNATFLHTYNQLTEKKRNFECMISMLISWSSIDSKWKK